MLTSYTITPYLSAREEIFSRHSLKYSFFSITRQDSTHSSTNDFSLPNA